MNLALCLPIPQLGFSRAAAPHPETCVLFRGRPFSRCRCRRSARWAAVTYTTLNRAAAACVGYGTERMFFLEAVLVREQAGGTWVWPTASAIFLQLEPRYQPWADSGGLFQEPGDGGCDEDAGGPGNVLIGRLDL